MMKINGKEKLSYVIYIHCNISVVLFQCTAFTPQAKTKIELVVFPDSTGDKLE